MHSWASPLPQGAVVIGSGKAVTDSHSIPERLAFYALGNQEFTQLLSAASLNCSPL